MQTEVQATQVPVQVKEQVSAPVSSAPEKTAVQSILDFAKTKTAAYVALGILIVWTISTLAWSGSSITAYSYLGSGFGSFDRNDDGGVGIAIAGPIFGLLIALVRLAVHGVLIYSLYKDLLLTKGLLVLEFALAAFDLVVFTIFQIITVIVVSIWWNKVTSGFRFGYSPVGQILGFFLGYVIVSLIVYGILLGALYLYWVEIGGSRSNIRASFQGFNLQNLTQSNVKKPEPVAVNENKEQIATMV